MKREHVAQGVQPDGRNTVRKERIDSLLYDLKIVSMAVVESARTHVLEVRLMDLESIAVRLKKQGVRKQR
jgi:hypothetical protein